MLTTDMVIYNDIPIEYDDSGFWTIQYNGDDLVFTDLSEAYHFIDYDMITTKYFNENTFRYETR